MRKGFYFSFDALMALTVMSASFFVVMQSSDVANDPYQSNEIDYRKSTITGQDALKLASQQKFSFFNESYQQKLLDNTVMTSEDLDRTIVDGITLMWAAENETYAKRTAKYYFDSKIPERYGYRVQVGETTPENILFNTTSDPNSTVVTSSSRLVSGHQLGKPNEGYQARLSLSEVTKKETKTRYIGGYVGDGEITYNVSLPDLDTVLNVSMEGDYSGKFDLFINGVDAGSYTPDYGNLTARSFDVCTNKINKSRCEALEPGNNKIRYSFTSTNQSIGGGLISITYNRTTTLQPAGGNNKLKKKRLPGIDGVINYYGGFYVPGDIKKAKAKIHYETDNQTFFVRVGNSTIYERRTIGEQTVLIDNQTIHDNLTGSNYDSISGQTVPLRVGLKNLDEVYDRAIADSVSVMDVSGSMDCGWNEDPPCKIDEAKNASKTFTEILLNASGNRAGFVSYNPSIVDTHELSDNYSSIEDTIESQEPGGGTCIACGILGATERYENPVVDNVLAKKSEWSYTTDYLDSRPPDKDGYNWTEENYNHTNWENSSAIIGAGPDADTVLSDYEGSVYLRKKIFLDVSKFKDLRLRLRSNDAATVYINGILVYNETSRHQGKYWNKLVTGDSTPLDSALVTGENVVAVKLRNKQNDTKHWIKDNETEWDRGTYKDTQASNNELRLTGEGSSLSFYDNFEDGSLDSNWSCTGSGCGVSTACATHGSYSAYHGEESGSLVSKQLDASGSAKANLSYWIRKGDDSCSEDPDGDEDLFVEYYSSGGSWQQIAFYDQGDYAPGEEITGEVSLPSDALHSGFKFRFRQRSGDGEGYDYWHIDNVEVETTKPASYASNGSYLSQQFDAGEQVEWKNSDIKSQISSDTSFSINYSDGSNWYKNLEDLPKSRYLKYNISLGTTDNSKTPTVDQTDISYLVHESNAGFDASLNATQKRKRSMIVLSDGEPTESTTVPGSGCSLDSGTYSGEDEQTIDAAYYAQKEYDAKVYVVGLGSNVNEDLLNMTARCGNGTYYYSNTDELESVFRNISNNILNASFVGQTVETSEEAALGTLYSDSRFVFNYTADDTSQYGSFELQQTSDRFGGDVESPKNGSFTIPEGVKPVSGSITSYSGNRWTDRAAINTSGSMQNFYKLWNYDSEYRQLGDPFRIRIPDEKIVEGVNKVQVDTALDKSNPEGASPDDRVLYTVRVNGSVGYGGLFENESFAEKDAKERLKEKLDVNNDGSPDVNIESNDVDLSATFTDEQPYIWGPAALKLVIWE